MTARRNPAREIVDTATLRRLSALSGADPRTIDKLLLGKPVKGDIAHRVAAVLIQLGIVVPRSGEETP